MSGKEAYAYACGRLYLCDFAKLTVIYVNKPV